MHRHHKALLALFCLLTMSQTFALPEDAHQKLFITADYSIYNYKTGEKIFTGNVKMDQGTTHVTADRLVVKNNNLHKIQEATAYGETTLAHYWTTPKADDKELHAESKVIKYYPITSNVVLEQNVVVTQGDNVFQGELIIYNMNDQIVTVPPSKNARAQLVYNPE